MHVVILLIRNESGRREARRWVAHRSRQQARPGANGMNGVDQIEPHSPTAHGIGPNALFGDTHVARANAVVIRQSAYPYWCNQ